MVDVLLFLRSDSESKLGTLGRTDENIQQSINQISPGQNLTFKVVDWNDCFEMFGSNNFFLMMHLSNWCLLEGLLLLIGYMEQY